MDTFYDINLLPIEKQEALMRKAYKICSKWWFDELNCRKSFARQKIEGISFDGAMSHFSEHTPSILIHRHSILEIKEYMEVGFNTVGNPIDYFLWIIVPINHKHILIEGLKEL